VIKPEFFWCPSLPFKPLTSYLTLVEDAEEMVRVGSYRQETLEKIVVNSQSAVRFARAWIASSSLVTKMSRLMSQVRQNAPKAPKT
jgi:hypothetical protein